ncbi:uncharacterized protein yc1106_02986 [Curvularia clavata]|uniref:Uncharacterized protein n=1 Tax=Curvularia clavata TaxID=95742 RepID=A0A9Q9DQL2_CURCL|nr:uncharacterized protein yc1106_02986 [Curvularia clavata]
MDPANHFQGYHSAYLGIAHQPDGNFSHFVRAPDVSHLQGGYWRYRSVQDDRLAMTYGFEKPEDLLIAVETSTDCEEYDKITLLWMKGAIDPNLRGVLSGTAAQHLRMIHEIRRLLGLPMSSRGQVPTYPISTDLRLKLYWDRIYDTLSTTSTVRPFDVVNQAMLPLAPRPLPPMVPQPPPSTHLRYISTVRPYHQHMNPYGPREELATLPVSTTHSQLSNPNAMAASSQQQLPAYPSFNQSGMSGIIHGAGEGQRSSMVTASSLLLRSAAPDVNNSVPLPHTATTRHAAATQPRPPSINGGFYPGFGSDLVRGPSSATPNINTGICPTFVYGQESAPTLPITNPFPVQPSNLGQLDEEVCMWCEEEESHDSDCPFGNLKFQNGHTVLDYGVLTDAVEQFDPGPWTVHFDQFPEAEPEDPMTQIAGMAEVMRGEDSYKNDVKLHGLRDEHLVMQWALKTCKGIKVVDEQAELS